MAAPTLDIFVREARGRVASGYYAAREPMAAGTPPSLGNAIRARAGRAVIAEIKPASPTEGPMRAQADAAALARAFATAGAAGVSVLVEPASFGGSLAAVSAAARAGLPVLFKDFVIDARQIDAARERGASAILLILDSLPDDELAVLIDHAHEAGIEALLEVYDRDGLTRALATRADMVGINNRDLRREGLPVDLGATARALAGIAPDRPILALSGVRSAEDAQMLFQAGATAILVGTALMRAQDPAAKLRELIEGLH